MRISTATLYEQGVNAMLDRQKELAFTQQQVATGKRITMPSDDVSGTTQSLALQQVIDTHQQFSRNSDVAKSRLQLEEGSITSTVDILQRVHELAIQAENTTLDAQSRADIAAEVRQHLDTLMGLANTADANGEYLFAGHNVGSVPFTAVENPVGSGLYDYNYNGDSGQRSVQIGTTRQIAVGDPGSDVFVNVPISGGGTQSIFETVEQFALDLESNTINTNTPTDMTKAIDHLGTKLAAIGARLNAIDSQDNQNQNVVLQGKQTLSDIQDLDYAEAITRLNQQLTGLQASQQSFAKVQGLSLFNYI
jgi:flagellar hook-associated protein 3 FlgL